MAVEPEPPAKLRRVEADSANLILQFESETGESTGKQQLLPFLLKLSDYELAAFLHVLYTSTGIVTHRYAYFTLHFQHKHAALAQIVVLIALRWLALQAPCLMFLTPSPLSSLKFCSTTS